MKEVTGEPVLSGSEAQAHCPTNSFEPLWATVDDLDSLDLKPEGIRDKVTGLLAPKA